VLQNKTLVLLSIAMSASSRRTDTKSLKGEETRATILETALRQASGGGFEALTIGTLAERTGLSKSGLFAHFGSKEELQIATIEEAGRRFTEVAFLPALKTPRGLPRLRALFANWLQWTERSGLPGGCPILTAIMEFDDRPGPVRQAILHQQQRLEDEMGRAVQMAVEMGHLTAGTDPRQMVFEMVGILSAFYVARRLHRDPQAEARADAAFERLVASSLS
jgi:AcrR family transcriptional regulator